MPTKYQLPRIITNDLYLAAFLLCKHCRSFELLYNNRRRVSFVFYGDNVRELRQEYESGVVRLNVRSFRDNLKSIRRKMDAEQRSVSHASPRSMQPVAQY